MHLSSTFLKKIKNIFQKLLAIFGEKWYNSKEHMYFLNTISKLLNHN